MKRLLLVLAIGLAAVPACGPVQLPGIVAAATTVGQLIDLFSDTIKPEYDEMATQCAAALEDAVAGAPNAVELSAACAQLTDSYLSVQHLVEQYRDARVSRSSPLDAEAQRRVDRWYESRARVQGAL